MASFTPSQPATMVRLCKKCRYHRVTFPDTRGVCLLFGKVDPVSGKRTYEHAREARDDRDKCSIEATYYVPDRGRLKMILYHSMPDLDPFNVVLLLVTLVVILRRALP